MTDHAIPGTAHQQLPDSIPRWNAGWNYLVIPWACPHCQRIIVQTVVSPQAKPVARSVPVGFSPIRMAEADEDGVPFFGPTRRAMRGKRERRNPAKLANEASRRARSEDAKAGTWTRTHEQDHSPIEAEEFETLCLDCPRRVRVRLADALPPS